jgi:hypothetical protein
MIPIWRAVFASVVAFVFGFYVARKWKEQEDE